jgi:uncharacterized protein (TIGR03067 family)
MSLRPLIALSAVLSLSVAAEPAKDDAKKELEKFQGTWSTVSIVMDGTTLDDNLRSSLKFVVKGDAFSIKGEDEIVKQYAKATLKLDPTTKPKSVDFTIGEGSEKGSVLEGIYEWNGDELKVCVKLTGKERPTEFASKENSQVALLVIKKDKN